MSKNMIIRFAACAAVVMAAFATLATDVPIKMMTYNVQYCRYRPEGSTSDVFDPTVTAARILAENPDFCCVNEVRDSEAHPEADALADATGMHKSFGGNASGSNGNLILSKEEPLGTETLFLKMSSAGWGDRYCHVCEFTNFCVAVVHLDTARESSGNDEVQASNAVAIATIRAAFEKYTKPVFLCGDWNTRPYWENMDRFNEFLEIFSPTNGVRTYHGHSATGGLILDYISVDKAHKDDFFVQSSYVVEDLITSDHNPVVAVVYRRPAASELGWVDEAFLSTGRTGTWMPSLAWDGSTWKAELFGSKTFTPITPSGGNRVTMEVTVAFDVIPIEYDAPSNTVQAAIWLGTNGCFQVWVGGSRSAPCGPSGSLCSGNPTPSARANLVATEDGTKPVPPMWLDVEAEGITPTTGVDYTFRFTFDYANRQYSVCVATTPSSSFIPLCTTDGGGAVVTQFPLATSASAVSGVRFTGDGVFTSLLGEWLKKTRGFVLSLF